MHYNRQIRTGSTGGAEALRLDGDPRTRWLKLVSVESPGCWIWTGSKDRHGYGQIDVYETGARKNWRAHRWVYTVMVRDLEDRETLDHLCRVHACVNPDHVEPVAHEVNVKRGAHGPGVQRKTHCKHGHELTPENTRVDKRGGRACVICLRENGRERTRRLRERRRTP